MDVDNRTHPIFQGTTNTNTVNFGLTTRCTMSCPKCTIEIPRLREMKVARHAPLELIKRDAVHLRGLRRLHLTGGEPTMHSEFPTIVEKVREWFDPEYLTIETNGMLYFHHRALFPKFDLVFITHYVEDWIYKGSQDNTRIIEQAEQDLGSKLIREAPVVHDLQHRPWSPGTPDEPCSKWKSPGLPAAWYDGVLYPCCVTVGIDRSLGIPVTSKWKEEIVKVPLGCAGCAFLGT